MKPNNWVSSSQGDRITVQATRDMAIAEKNYKALEAVQVKSFDMGGFSIRAQFNPARIVSTGAKVDARSLKERKCFLCPENLPVEPGATAFRLSPSGIVQPLPDLPPAFHDPYPETFSATDIAAME